MSRVLWVFVVALASCGPSTREVVRGLATADLECGRVEVGYWYTPMQLEQGAANEEVWTARGCGREAAYLCTVDTYGSSCCRMGDACCTGGCVVHWE